MRCSIIIYTDEILRYILVEDFVPKKIGENKIFEE